MDENKDLEQQTEPLENSTPQGEQAQAVQAPEEPEADEPKADEPKAEEPKAEEAKPEEDKPEAVPVEAAVKEKSREGMSTLRQCLLVAAVAVLIICGLFTAYMLTKGESASAGGEETEGETEYVEPEPVFAPKSIIMIQIQDLGDGIINSEYKGNAITPNLNALAKENLYFKNNISASKYAQGLDIVLASGLYAPEYDPAIYGMRDKGIITLGHILGEKGYNTLAVTSGPKGAYGGKDAYAEFGYGDFVTVEYDDLGKTDVYSKALEKIKGYEGYFFVSVTDLCLYTGKTEIEDDKIGQSRDVANMVKKLQYADEQLGEFIAGLKEAGLYEDTVIIITGTGAALDPESSLIAEAMAEISEGYNYASYVKAPLMVKLPGENAASPEYLTSHTDVFPTLARYLGLNTKHLYFSGGGLFEESSKEYIGSVLHRGSYIDDKCVVIADETATARLSNVYTMGNGRLRSASGLSDQINESESFFLTEDKLVAYGVQEKCKALKVADVMTEFEKVKDEITAPISYSVADVFPEGEGDDFYKSSIKLFNRSVMFSANEFKGEYVSVIFKNNGLTLIPGATEGVFISDDVSMGGSFQNMVASWNCSSKGGTVEISVSVKLKDGTYTDWYSWGQWSAIKGKSASVSNSDKYGSVGIDILTLNEKCQGTVRYRIDIKKTGNEAPTVYNVTLACDKSATKLKAPTTTYKKLNVPYRYQLDVPTIGGVICSPTSLSMALDFLGEPDFDTADTAYGVYDNGEEIYGNWAFNVAYAGELGYNAFLDYYDVDAIKWALYKDHPIVSSIRVTQGQLAGSGYPNYSTRGHLICVVGYDNRDGKDWLLINDPAHPEVTRILASEFETIYRGVSYIVQVKPEKFLWRIGEGTDRDITVVADYIPEGRYNRPGGSYPVKYIVIHNTGNFSATATALAHRNYLKNPDTTTSWMFTVDDTSIYKHLPEEEKAWHAGDGRDGKGNTYGIGIEICVNHEYQGSTTPTDYFKTAVSNASQLVAELMYKYDLSISQVKQHNYFSGKNCPQNMREGKMWDDFIKECQQRYDALCDKYGDPE